MLAKTLFVLLGCALGYLAQIGDRSRSPPRPPMISPIVRGNIGDAPVDEVTDNNSATHITVSPNTEVSHEDEAEGAHAELLISAHPFSRDVLTACSMVVKRSDPYIQAVSYETLDGGATWQRRDRTNGVFAADPTCAYGVDGSRYFAAEEIAHPNDYIFARDDSMFPNRFPLYIQRPRDNASHRHLWTHVGTDRPFIVVDNTTGLYRGRVYMSAYITHPGTYKSETIGLWHSGDNGESFIGPVTWRSRKKDSAGIVTGGNTIGVHGTVLISFTQKINSSIAETSSEPQAQRNQRGASRIFVAASVDGGATIREPVLVDTITDAYQPLACECQPMMATDRSEGPFRGRTYVVWNEFKDGRSQIMLAYSDDEGLQWSKASIVNDDAPPIDPAHGPDHSMAAIAVNKAGIVAVTWLDRSRIVDGIGYFQRFSASLDGGETFLSSVQVSEAPEDVSKAGRAPLLSPVYSPSPGISANATINLRIDESRFIGDTAGLTADAAGRFHALWSDNRTGMNQAWTSTITVEGRVLKHGDAELSTLADITRTLSWYMNSASYDHERKIVTVNLVLTNQGNRFLHPPIYMRMLSLSSRQSATVEMMNTANGIGGVGAVADLSGYIPRDGLPPQATMSVMFRFHLSDIKVSPEMTNEGILLMKAIILNGSGN